MNAEAGDKECVEQEQCDCLTRQGLRWSVSHPVSAAAVYAAAYLAVELVGAAFSIIELPIWAAGAMAITVTTVALAFSLLMVLSVCRFRISALGEWTGIVLMMVIFSLSRPEAFAIAGRWLHHDAGGQRLAQMLLLFPGQGLFGNLALIWWAVFLGRLVSRVIREGNLLVPVAAVASLMDIITVFWGVVAHVSEKAPEVLQTFSAQTPVTPPAGVNIPVLTQIGIGDFLFISLFLAVIIRHAMNAAITLWIMFVIMLMAPFAFIIWPQALGMPGLPFISLAVVVVNWRYFKFSSSEKKALAVAGGMIAIGLVFWILLRR